MQQAIALDILSQYLNVFSIVILAENLVVRVQPDIGQTDILIFKFNGLIANNLSNQGTAGIVIVHFFCRTAGRDVQFLLVTFLRL